VGAPTSKPEFSTGHPITKATTGGCMTNFIALNSVTRRYLKRGELMAKRRAEASQNALQQESRKSTRVDRATSLDFPRDYVAGESGQCLPEIALFAAWHRKSKQVTAR